MKKFIKIILSITAFIIVVILGFYTFAYISGPPELNNNRYLKLYDNQDELFYESINNYSGQYAKLEDISQDFLDSIVAIEDHNFYQHRGFDPVGILRAVIVNLTNQSKSQGASTISQQYARLLYLNNDKTWSRKINEAYLTMKLETHLSKDEILEGYVNNVYFGHGIYGIENAAHYFYDKDAKDLDLNESSMLAGIINGPTYYSPLNDETKAKQRQKLVLQALVNENKISEARLAALDDSDLNLADEHISNENIDYYYFKDTVISELEELGYYTDYYFNKGLNVYTTLDTGYQDTLNKSTTKNTDDKKVQTAGIVVEPYTGKIVALSGGNDYSKSQYNRAILANRQIGSTIKPFLYYLALENGFDVTTKFKDEPTTFKLDNNETYAPTNYNNKYAYKDVTMAQALAVSDNIYAVKTHLFLGCDKLANLIEQFGYQNVESNPSLALGTLNTNVYGLANMYNALASEGEYQHIYTITKICDNDGNVLYLHKDNKKQLLNQDTCLILNQLLTSSFDKQFSTYLSATMQDYQFDNINACKTGTSDFDSLAVCYNPNVLVVTWTGFDDNQELNTYLDRKVSKDIMADVINYTNEIKEAKWYSPTDEIEEIKINALTGEKEDSGTVYWFKKKTAFL